MSLISGGIPTPTLGKRRSADGSSACCLASVGTRGRAVRAPTHHLLDRRDSSHLERSL